MKLLDFIISTRFSLDSLSKKVQAAAETAEHFPYNSPEFHKAIDDTNIYKNELHKIKDFFEQQTNNIDLSDIDIRQNYNYATLLITLLESKFIFINTFSKRYKYVTPLIQQTITLSNDLSTFKQSIIESSYKTAEQETQLKAYQKELYELNLKFFEIQVIDNGLITPNIPNLSEIPSYLSSCQQLTKDILDAINNRKTDDNVNNNQTSVDIAKNLTNEIIYKIELLQLSFNCINLIQLRIANLTSSINSSINLSVLQKHETLIDLIEARTKEIITEFNLLVQKNNLQEEKSDNSSSLLQEAIVRFKKVSNDVQNRIKELSERYSELYNRYLENNSALIICKKLDITLKEAKNIPSLLPTSNKQDYFSILYNVVCQYKQRILEISKHQQTQEAAKQLLKIRAILDTNINNFGQLNYAFLNYQAESRQTKSSKFIEDFLLGDISLLKELFPKESALTKYEQSIQEILSSASEVLSHIDEGTSFTTTALATLNTLKKFKIQNFIVIFDAKEITKTTADFNLYDLVYAIASFKKLIAQLNDNSDPLFILPAENSFCEEFARLFYFKIQEINKYFSPENKVQDEKTRLEKLQEFSKQIQELKNSLINAEIFGCKNKKFYHFPTEDYLKAHRKLKDAEDKLAEQIHHFGKMKYLTWVLENDHKNDIKQFVGTLFHTRYNDTELVLRKELSKHGAPKDRAEKFQRKLHEHSTRMTDILSTLDTLSITKETVNHITNNTPLTKFHLHNLQTVKTQSLHQPYARVIYNQKTKEVEWCFGFEEEAFNLCEFLSSIALCKGLISQEQFDNLNNKPEKSGSIIGWALGFLQSSPPSSTGLKSMSTINNPTSAIKAHTML